MAVIAFDPEIPVFDRFAKAFPLHSDGAPAVYGPFSEACSTTFEWDAHFAAYSQPTIQRRLGGTGALTLEPKMVLLVLDVDGPDHKWTPDWWEREKAKLREFFKRKGRGYAYTTKGGYRIVLALKTPMVLRTVKDALRWRFSYLDWIAEIQREFDINCDDKCADWTRLYRLPRVLRDGIPQIPIDEVNRADRVLEWRDPYVAEDDPRVQREESAGYAVPEPAPVEDDDLQEAADALVRAWPPRARHYAGLALCGALARAGWSDSAITDFVGYVMLKTCGDPEVDKWSKAAYASVNKVFRGEDVTGWPKLAELMTTGPDGRLDPSRTEVAEAAVLACRRAIGQGPAIELFEKVVNRPATDLSSAAEAKVLLRTPMLLEPTAPEDATATAEAFDLEAAGNTHYRNLLDNAAERLEPLVKAADAKKSGVDARPMGLTYRELRKRNAPPPDYIIQYLVTREGVGAISGEPKSGKSWDATHMAVCVAAGLKVFGTYEVAKPRKVFYYYAEDTEASINNRIRAIAAGMGLDPDGAWSDNLVVQPRGRPLDVMALADLCVVVASVRRFEDPGDPFGLVILDPLSNIHSGEEDKRDSMVRVMSRLHAVEQVLGSAILFVHHSGKTSGDNKGRRRGGQKMRGSSVIHGAVDHGLYLDNLRGDGKGEFVCRMESEVKAARGAGVVDRRLVIEDDAFGNAIKATWVVGEPEEEKPEEPTGLAAERAVTVVQKLFDQGAPLTRDELKTKIRGKTDLLAQAITIAEDEGWIAQKFVGQRPCGFEITPAGIELVRRGRAPNGDGEGGDPAPTPTDPVGGFLASMIREQT